MALLGFYTAFQIHGKRALGERVQAARVPSPVLIFGLAWGSNPGRRHDRRVLYQLRYAPRAILRKDEKEAGSAYLYKNCKRCLAYSWSSRRRSLRRQWRGSQPSCTSWQARRPRLSEAGSPDNISQLEDKHGVFSTSIITIYSPSRWKPNMK